MDFTVDFGNPYWRFSPTSSRARRWVQRNPDAGGGHLVRTDELVVRRENGRMILRALRADKFNVPDPDERERVRDYADQYSTLLIARAKRSAGYAQEALENLVALRREILEAIEPKSQALLADVDGEIALALEVCRTDRVQPRRSGRVDASSNVSFKTWVQRVTSNFEWTMVHTAISIILAIDVFRLIASLL